MHRPTLERNHSFSIPFGFEAQQANCPPHECQITASDFRRLMKKARQSQVIHWQGVAREDKDNRRKSATNCVGISSVSRPQKARRNRDLRSQEREPT